MATLYVENFPDELYAALRKRAKERRSSIAAEITGLVSKMFPPNPNSRLAGIF
jgi:plasmid stability protein